MFLPAHSPRHNVSVRAADFSGWLLRNVAPEDHVVIHMDIAGAGSDLLGLPQTLKGLSVIPVHDFPLSPLCCGSSA